MPPEEPMITHDQWKTIVVVAMSLFLIIGLGFVSICHAFDTVCNLIGFLIIGLGFGGISYNLLITADTNVLEKQGNLQASLEQRADLIPNIVSTIEGSESFEKSTLVDVVSERGRALGVKDGVSSAKDATGLSTASTYTESNIGRLLAIFEQYPQLKTTDQFLALQKQLSDTETQIRTSRNEYNSAVKDYQLVMRSFPTNVFAKMFGYSDNRYQMFTADISKQAVPVVQFGGE